MKVLVVDDDVVIPMSFQMTWDDIEVIELTRFHEVLRTVDDVSYDAIVVDKRLPDGDGLELVRRLRCRASTMQTPIVIVSAADETDAIEVLKAGADAFLPKPCEPARVREVIERVVAIPPRSRRAHRSNAIDRLSFGRAPEGMVIDLRNDDTASWRDSVSTPRDDEPARGQFWRRGRLSSGRR